MEQQPKTSRPWLHRVLLFVGGVTVTHGFSIFGDYVIFPIVTLALGFWKSLPIMFAISFAVNCILVTIYDRLKRDIFGFEELKKMQAKGEMPGNKKFLYKLLKLGDIPFFIVLAWYDPFFAVIYKRKGSEYAGFSKRDFWILVLATLIGSSIWTAVWSGGWYLVKLLFHAL